MQPAHDRALLGRIICLTNLGRHQDAIDRAADTARRLQALQTRADVDPAYREHAAPGLRGSIDADGKQQHLAALMAASHLVAGGDLVAARPLVDLAAEDPALAHQVTKLRTRLDAAPRAP